MIGDAALREIISADTLAPVPRSHETAAVFRPFSFASAVIVVVQSRTQDFERPLLIFQLRTLVLTGDDDSRREMRDPNRPRRPNEKYRSEYPCR